MGSTIELRYTIVDYEKDDRGSSSLCDGARPAQRYAYRPHISQHRGLYPLGYDIVTFGLIVVN